MLDESLQQFCQSGWTIEQQLSGSGWCATISIDGVNQRLKILSYEAKDISIPAEACKQLATERDLGKILLYVNEGDTVARERLAAADFLLEGTIPGFYSGTTALCYAHFTKRSRAYAPFWPKEEQIIKAVMANQNLGKSEDPLPSGYCLRPVTAEDAEHLADLYRHVFTSYPSPLFHEDYIRQVMGQDVYFLAVFHDRELISAGSTEIDKEHANAEITDLATHPTGRGLGLATTIIAALEQAMWQRGLTCLYSLARAGTVGVNRGLYKLGYAYRGRMINNCHIGGRFEDMNIWVKQSPTIPTHCRNIQHSGRII